MRRTIYILITISLLVLTLSIFIKPIISYFAKKQLQNVSLESGVSIEGFLLKRLSPFSIIRGRLEGDFYLRKIQYNKLRIDDIQGRFLLERRRLFLSSLYAHVLGGDVSGDSGFIMDKSAAYSFNLKLTDLDMEKFVNDFNLKEKFLLTGKLSGAVNLLAEKADIKALSGDFSTSESGGVLIIKDNKFLENMAINSGQSLDILVENFQNYRYNTGMMKLSFDKGNLIFNIDLEGGTGKRNLSITLHDFKLGSFAK